MAFGRKRIAWPAATVIVLAIAVGVAVSSASAGPKRATATLRTMGFGLPDEIAKVRVEEAKKAVGTSNDFQMDTGGFDEQKFLSAVASGNPPDLIYMDRQLIGTYANRGALQSLTSCIRNQKINMSQYRDASRREVTFKGVVYGIPEFLQSRNIIINRPVLANAHVKLTDIDTSNWSKLASVNRKLLKRSGGKVTRIGFDPKLPEFFPLWAKANGVDILSKDGRKAHINDPRAVAALTYAVGLINAHGGWGAFKSFRDTWDFFGAKNQVQQGQVGAWPMEDFYYSNLARSSPGVKIYVANFKNRKGVPIDYTTGNTWAIPRGAKNPSQACVWMKAMTRWESWVKAAEARKAVRKAAGLPFLPIYSGNKIADQKIINGVWEASATSPYFKQAVRTNLRSQRFAFSIPPSPAGAEFHKAWEDAVNRVLGGQQRVKAALDQAQREAQRALDRARN
jgi:multiple sugar transport system substrate-binding protein